MIQFFFFLILFCQIIFTKEFSESTTSIQPILKSCSDQNILKNRRQSLNSVNVFDSNGTLARVRVRQVKTLLLFFGYGRSGHSLVAALLDSHPQIAIANGFVELMEHQDGVLNGTSLLEQIISRSMDRASHENRVAGYSYKVKGAHNGKFENLKVVGVKKGGNPSSLGTVFTNKKQQLAAVDDLKMVARCLGCSLRILHVLRNPFDMLTAQVLRKNTSFYQPHGKNFNAEHVLKETSVSNEDEVNRQNPNNAWRKVHEDKQIEWRDEPFSNAINNFKRRHTALHKLKNIFGARVWQMLKLETIITSPRTTILELCQWLGVECSESYIDACTKKMFSEPHLSRFHVKWNMTMRDHLNMFMSRSQFPELFDYRWYG